MDRTELASKMDELALFVGDDVPLKKLATEAAAAIRESEWRPIESAPKDGTLVLLGNNAGAWMGRWHPLFQSGYKPDNCWFSMLLNHDHMQRPDGRPTHWMPLPPPPAIDAARKEGCEHR